MINIKNYFSFEQIMSNKMTWNDINYRQFNLIREALTIEDETDKLVAVAQAIYGDDVIELPIGTFKELCSGLSFLSEQIPNDLTVKNVNVNGREYYFSGLFGNISAAQYIDFQNYLKAKDELKQFSVFFIPKNHKYNDGYDMLEVFEDIQDMSIPVLTSASFFFLRQLKLFISIFQHYSAKRIENLNLPKDMKKTIMEIVDHSSNLAFSHLS